MVDDFASTVRGGDRRVSLEALRDLLASQIQCCDSNRDLAALSQRLMDVLAQIEAAGGATKANDPEEDTLDELARRRAERGADTAGVEPSGSGQSG